MATDLKAGGRAVLCDPRIGFGREVEILRVGPKNALVVDSWAMRIRVPHDHLTAIGA